jgi:hypothetical protein
LRIVGTRASAIGVCGPTIVGLVTGLERVGGIGPQMYHAYPGCMEVREAVCEDECEYQALTASAQDLRAGLVA